MKVLIVEDDAQIAAMLARALRLADFIPDVCTTGADAVSQARTIAYEVILLDWILPDLDGLTVCRALRRSGVTVPIIMLTGRAGLRERVLALEGGADDYMVKPFEIEELIARIHALVRRTHGFCIMTLGELQLDRLQRRVILHGEPLDLTAHEYALLVFLASKSDQVVTRDEIFAHAWPSAPKPNSNLVDVHISRLRDKFGPFAWMIGTQRGKGYRLRTDPSK